MTRTYRHSYVGALHGARDILNLTALSNDDAVRRVRGLRAAGWSDEIIGTACGWPVDLVRRAIEPAARYKGCKA